MFDYSNLIGEEKSLPVEFKDPFKKENVQGIAIYFTRGYDGNTPRWWGYIKFTNGETSGKQDFEEENFDVIVTKIANFIKKL